MKVLVLGRRDVEALLPIGQCIDVIEEALTTLARDDALNPLRTATWFSDRRGLLGLMPGVIEAPPIAGVKVVTVMPENEGTPFESHQGAVLLFELDHGCPVAIVDAAAITAIRTAAASGVATRLLAREDARRLAVLGSGVQARAHIGAMTAVRSIREIVVWSRSEPNADRLAREVTEPVEVVSDAETAVRGADIVCTTTASREPVLSGAWLDPGTHVNAVGACIAACRELDTEAVVRSRFYVDRVESAVNESGDFLIPKREGAIGDDHIVGEIGDVLLGKAPGRGGPEEITIFESLGLAIEDLAAARYVFTRAAAAGRGVAVDL